MSGTIDPKTINQGVQLYEGKAKKVYATNDDNLVIIH